MRPVSPGEFQVTKECRGSGSEEAGGKKPRSGSAARMRPVGPYARPKISMDEGKDDAFAFLGVAVQWSAEERRKWLQVLQRRVSVLEVLVQGDEGGAGVDIE